MQPFQKPFEGLDDPVRLDAQGSSGGGPRRGLPTTCSSRQRWRRRRHGRDSSRWQYCQVPTAYGAGELLRILAAAFHLVDLGEDQRHRPPRHRPARPASSSSLRQLRIFIAAKSGSRCPRPSSAASINSSAAAEFRNSERTTRKVCGCSTSSRIASPAMSGMTSSTPGLLFAAATSKPLRNDGGRAFPQAIAVRPPPRLVAMDFAVHPVPALGFRARLGGEFATCQGRHGGLLQADGRRPRGPRSPSVAVAARACPSACRDRPSCPTRWAPGRRPFSAAPLVPMAWWAKAIGALQRRQYSALRVFAASQT